MKLLSFYLSLIVTLNPCAQSLALAENSEDLAVTIYSSADPAGFNPQQFIAQQQQGYNPLFASTVPGFGLIKEIRPLELKSGINELKFTDVAQFIDPTTVSFSDLEDPTTIVHEQNFQFDLVSPDKLLQRYIGHEIKVLVQKGDNSEVISGELLSAMPGANQLVVKTAEGIQLLNRYGPQVKLGDLPGGLISKPTLVWKVGTKKAGPHKIRTSYQTDGITWRADYNLVLAPQETTADLNAWVSVMNVSGASYENARLKLIAGDVQRVHSDASQERHRVLKSAMSAMDEAGAPGFEEKSFFEYHLYTLPVRTNIVSNSTQQITLFPQASGIKTEKVLVYYGLPEAASWNFFGSPMTDRSLGNSSNKKVDIYLRFANEEKNNLGKPLPKGKIRVFKQDDADGSLEFIGEDLIDHTPRDEKVLIKLGQAFDIVGERIQTDFNSDLNGHRITESFKITLKNHKDSPQKVLVRENLYRWTNWEITQKSDSFEKLDSRTIHFPIELPAKGEKSLSYTVRYTW